MVCPLKIEPFLHWTLLQPHGLAPAATPASAKWKNKMMIGFRSHPSDFGKRPFQHNATYCTTQQLRRLCVTKLGKLIMAYISSIY